MRDGFFEDLSHLADARFRAEQLRIQAILAEETRIRASITQLQESQRRARAAATGELQAQRSFGGDALWEGWVSRIMRDLQTRLAQVLVRKSALMRDLAHAHGKLVAAEDLQQKVRKSRQGARQKSRNEALQSLFILQKGEADKNR
jgi:hypothetical protein